MIDLSRRDRFLSGGAFFAKESDQLLAINERFQDCKEDTDYRALDKAVADFNDVIVETLASKTVQKAS